MMPSLAAYIRHAEEYGGLRDCWEVACKDLSALDLGKLAEALREQGARRRRVGRKGKTATVERFSLTHAETVALIELLIGVGVDDADIRRYASASQSMVGAIRSDRGSDPHISPNLEPAPQGIIRNEVEIPTCPTSPPAEALRSPDSQTCGWCSAPLPSTLRTGARYCLGGRCKQAAHRARRSRALDLDPAGA
jgi:hypothetical protein